MRKVFLLVLLFFLLAVSLSYWKASTGWLALKSDRQLVKLSLRPHFWSRTQKEILVELVKTPVSTVQGLSDRLELKSSDGQAIDGMLFVFPESQPLAFWMKDMHFAIDICWLRKVNFLACVRQVPPPQMGEAPATVKSPAAVNMVLETLPGFLTDEDLNLKLFFQ